MVDIYIMIIFGILGIGTGVAIPAISNKIIILKNHKTMNLYRGFEINNSRLIAVLNGILWMYAGIKLENAFIAFLVSLIFTVAILISVIDLQIRLIPNELIILITSLGITFQIIKFGWMSILYSFFCMVAVGFFFILAARIVGFEQVGAGDIKLIAAIGLLLGYPYIKIALIGMSIALLIFCLGGLTMKKLTVRSTFAFAPFIMFGTICTLIYIINFKDNMYF
ncbi:MAG: prepilin peptidase [Aminipila sp.]